MIIDSHCHAWEYWPYQDRNDHEPNQLPVPNPETWGNVEQLIYEMGNNNIDKATIVSAQIWHNPENNKYIANSVNKYKDKLYQFADVDSNWSSTYQMEGAADRLDEISEKLDLVGFSHYIGSDDGEWLFSEEGLKFFSESFDSIKGKTEKNLFLILSGKVGKKVKIKSDLLTEKLEDIMQWSQTKFENI